MNPDIQEEAARQLGCLITGDNGACIPPAGEEDLTPAPYRDSRRAFEEVWQQKLRNGEGSSVPLQTPGLSHGASQESPRVELHGDEKSSDHASIYRDSRGAFQKAWEKCLRRKVTKHVIRHPSCDHSLPSCKHWKTFKSHPKWVKAPSKARPMRRELKRLARTSASPPDPDKAAEKLVEVRICNAKSVGVAYPRRSKMIVQNREKWMRILGG